MARFPLHRFVLLVGALLLLGGGCPWSGFEDVSRKAPVQAIDKPDGFTSPQFGKAMIVLRHPNHPRTLVVGGLDTDVLAVIHLNGHGNLGSKQVARISPNDLAGGGDRKTDLVQSMTQISDDGDGNPRVLVGVPDENYVRVVTLPADGDPEAAPDRIDPRDASNISFIKAFGGALTAAPLDAEPALDWVVADRDHTFVFFNGDTAQLSACDTPSDTAEPVDGELVAGHFFEADGMDVMTVARGAPQTTGAGRVLLIRPTGTGLTCSALVLGPTAGSEPSSFGQSLAAADVNDDGVDDLAVGMPAGNGNGVVAIFLSEGPAGARTLPTSPTFELRPSETDGKSFARRVAWLDLDGHGTVELAVSDPEVAYGPRSQGRVHLFGGDWTNPDSITEKVVGDTSGKETVAGITLGDGTSSLGLWLGGLSWGDATWPGEELVAGGLGRILIFFRSSWPGDDGDEADPRS